MFHKLKSMFCNSESHENRLREQRRVQSHLPVMVKRMENQKAFLNLLRIHCDNSVL